MRVVIQRVREAHVSVGEQVLDGIGPGLCILVGVGKEDCESNADFLAEKIKNLRIFEDEQGKMNRSVVDTRGELLVVSQFTLYGDLKKGNRPSFTDAASPVEAQRLYEYFVERLRKIGLPVATGQFQAKMNVWITNDGPVTFILES